MNVCPFANTVGQTAFIANAKVGLLLRAVRSFRPGDRAELDRTLDQKRHRAEVMESELKRAEDRQAKGD